MPEGQVPEALILGPSDTELEAVITLADRGYHLTLLDASVEALKRVKHKIPEDKRGNFTYAVGDITGVMIEFGNEVINASCQDVSFETFVNNVDRIAKRKLNEVPSNDNGFMSSEFVFYNLKGKKRVTVGNDNAFICSQFVFYNLEGDAQIKEVVEKRFGEGSFGTIKGLDSYRRLSATVREKHFNYLDGSLTDFGTLHIAEKHGPIGEQEDIQRVRDPLMDYLIGKKFQPVAETARWFYDLVPGELVFPVLAHSLKHRAVEQGLANLSLGETTDMGAPYQRYSSELGGRFPEAQVTHGPSLAGPYGNVSYSRPLESLAPPLQETFYPSIYNQQKGYPSELSDVLPEAQETMQDSSGANPHMYHHAYPEGVPEDVVPWAGPPGGSHTHSKSQADLEPQEGTSGSHAQNENSALRKKKKKKK